jgi:hypothetical protein
MPLNLSRALFVDCKHLSAVAANAMIENSPKLVENKKTKYSCFFYLFFFLKEYINLEVGSGVEDDPRRRALKVCFVCFLGGL